MFKTSFLIEPESIPRFSFDTIVRTFSRPIKALLKFVKFHSYKWSSTMWFMESGVVTKSVVKNGGSDPFRIGRCRSLKSASTECKLSSRQSKRWLDRTEWGGGEDGETMGWFEIPVGVSIEGIYPRFEANFSICLEKSRPWANAPNQYTRQANPPRVSPFPTGNTCKPRLHQPLDPRRNRGWELPTWNSISPGTNYSPWLGG